ncbi:MAG: response regulator [Gammaproteobacteria bacterium]|nr:response regulator [Gammaproteobacteria bacterium]
MTASKHFSVGVFGVPELERQVLERIFSLSSTRTNAYRMLVEPDGQPVDIILVDRLNAAAVSKVQALNGSAPVVGVVREAESKEPYFVRRPFTATRTLSVLDRVVDEALNDQGHAAAAAPTQDQPATPTPADTDSFNPRARAPSPAATGSDSFNPRARAPSAAKGSQPAAARPLEDTVQFRTAFLAAGYRALVVDDSLPVRKQVSMALERCGIKADQAEDGDTALKLVSETNYNIIFLDVIMPGVDGYEVCKTIKRDKLKKNIPIVMLTGKSSPFDKVKGKLSGCDTYLTKPVSIKEFKRTLTKCLKEPMAFDSLAGLN